MKTWALVILLLLPHSSHGAGTPYAQLSAQDKRDFVLHGGIAYAANLTGALVFKKMGLKPGLAILLSSVLVAGAAYYKEKKMDKFYSGSDMSGGMTGVGASALTFAILEF